MLLSFNWLRDLVMPRPKDPQKVALAFHNLGHELEKLTAVGDDWVIDLTINPNRGDCLCHWGLAREFAAVWKLETQFPDISANFTDFSSLPARQITIEAPEHCHRYIARVAELSREVGSSPSLITERLSVCSTRPINALVDICNYVMLEMGQPLHVFDLDKVEGSIIVRLSRSGERLLALDGREYELPEGILLIADEKKPLAIAGVIGGEESAVSASTHRILLECAYFAPSTIRRSARTLGISTESSFRYERDIDQTTMMNASNHAMHLFADYASTLPVKEIVDVEVAKPQPINLEFRLEYGQRLLGVPLDSGQVCEIFSSLGMKVTATSDRTLKLIVPSWRKDLLLEADLAEEIARIIGYDSIPTKPVECCIPNRNHHPTWVKLHDLAEVLSGLGFYEACLPSITSADYLNKLYGEKLVEWCSDLALLSQPLSGDMDCLTPSQMPTMLSALVNNVKMGNLAAAFWSLGYVFHKRYRDYFSKPVLTIGIYGSLQARNWQQSERPADLFLLKGVLQVIWERLRLDGNFTLLPVEHPLLEPGQSAAILWGDETVGLLGEMNNNLVKEYRFPNIPVLLEMDLNRVYGAPFTQPEIVVPSHFPVIKRDLSILIPEKTSIGKVLELIYKMAGELAESVTLADMYSGKNVPKGKISFLVAINFRHPNRTLTDEEISPLVERIVAELTARFDIELRV